ncbi:MAG: hypothetical protein JST37_02575 [Bacteroidetes bacterium]|nr:hypothetical protein [Bacteroidota bacterium]MBS1980227.1 hypothetical protein [Bacteroidota bacterium]
MSGEKLVNGKMPNLMPGEQPNVNGAQSSITIISCDEQLTITNDLHPPDCPESQKGQYFTLFENGKPLTEADILSRATEEMKIKFDRAQDQNGWVYYHPTAGAYGGYFSELKGKNCDPQAEIVGTKTSRLKPIYFYGYHLKPVDGQTFHLEFANNDAVLNFYEIIKLIAYHSTGLDPYEENVGAKFYLEGLNLTIGPPRLVTGECNWWAYRRMVNGKLELMKDVRVYAEIKLVENGLKKIIAGRKGKLLDESHVDRKTWETVRDIWLNFKGNQYYFTLAETGEEITPDEIKQYVSKKGQEWLGISLSTNSLQCDKVPVYRPQSEVYTELLKQKNAEIWERRLDAWADLPF